MTKWPLSPRAEQERAKVVKESPHQHPLDLWRTRPSLESSEAAALLLNCPWVPQSQVSLLPRRWKSLLVFLRNLSQGFDVPIASLIVVPLWGLVLPFPVLCGGGGRSFFPRSPWGCWALWGCCLPPANKPHAHDTPHWHPHLWPGLLFQVTPFVNVGKEKAELSFLERGGEDRGMKKEGWKGLHFWEYRILDVFQCGTRNSE